MFLFLLILLVSLRVEAQENLFHPRVHNYSYIDYKAGTSNWWVIEDDRGIIYVANREGILEYDGQSWNLIQSPDKEVARSLVKDNKGVIYAGFVGDMGYLAPNERGEVQFISLKSKLPKEYQAFREIWSTLYYEGDVYFQTHQHLFRWTGTEMQVLTPQNNINGICVIRDQLYAGIYDIGLCKLVGGEFELVPGGEIFANRRIYDLLPYGDEGLVIGTQDDGFFLHDGVSWERWHTEIDEEIKSQIYLPGLALDDGRMIINTLNNGVYILDQQGDVLQHINKEVGLQDNAVDYIYVDTRGILWMALFNGIATVDLNSKFTYLSENSGLPTNTVNDCIRHNGILYLGTANGLYYYDDTSSEIKLVQGTFGQVYQFLTHRGRLYSSTNKMGLFEVVGKEIKYVRQNINGDFIVGMMRLSPADSNRMLIDQRPGLASLYYNEAKGIFQEESSTDKMRAIYPGFEVDKNGHVWTLGRNKGTVEQLIPKTNNGIYNLDNAEIIYHDEQNGLPSKIKGIIHINGEIDFLGEDIYGFRHEDGSFYEKQPFYASLQKSGAQYFSFPKKDERGRTWIQAGLGTGVSTSSESNLEAVNYKPFTEIKDLPIWGIHPDQELENGNSLVWFTGPQGMVRYEGNIGNVPSQPFQVLLRRITIDEDELVYGGSGEAPHDLSIEFKRNTIDFSYSAVCYHQEDILYQTFLEGLDEGWSKTTSISQRTFSNLPAGEYTFHVRAKNIYDEMSDESSYSFEVQPSIWRTWWMWILYLLSFGLIAWSVDRWRAKQHRNREQELKHVIEDRTQEVVEEREKVTKLYEYQTTLLSEVHHRIKNNLQLVMSLLTLQKAKIKDEFDTDILDMLSHRINSIALIHEQLYNQKKFDKLDTHYYADHLLQNFNSLILERNISASFDIKDIHLNLETITPLGLIWSELISNSIKANPHIDRLVIFFKLERKGDDFFMHYFDNGAGYPSGQFESNSKGMGHNIINSLARQLAAKTNNYNDGGAHFTMEFVEKQISHLS